MMPTVTHGITPVREVLDNGAAVIVQETSTSPAVTIDAAFRAGSVCEPPSLPGLAFLTARVLDRGTERRSADAIAEALDERGVSLRVSVTRHLLNVSCTCLAEDFDDLLALVVDVARRPVFPDPEIVKRKAETVTALRQDEDNPAVRAVECLFEMLYGTTHPYGRRTKGTVESVQRIDRSALVDFHSRHVAPATLSLVIVGDVRPPRAIGRAAEELDGWSAAVAPPAIVPPPPAAAGRRRRDIPMPGKPQADIAYGITTIRRLDPRYYAYWMMNNILGQFGLGGRLADNIRERQGMAYYAFSSFDPNVGEGPLFARAGVDPRNVERAIEAIDHEIDALGREGPTPEEVAETRQSLIGSMARTLETNQSIASFLQTIEQFGLGLDYHQRLPGLLAAVTREEIAAAAAEALSSDRAALAVAGPSEAPA